MSARLPSLTPREVVAALRQAGFVFHHQRGSHAFYQHQHHPLHWVTVPMHAKSIKKGTPRSIIRQSRLSHDEFLGLL